MKRMKKLLCSLFVVALAIVSLQALAETQTGGREFNHMTTGFPLSGGHASAACETCHNGGVFKGTPRNCDGCHALGRRIVATPKSNSHIITDAPCESCHFNTVTWLGARFNHGTAKIGQCVTCHNGRIAAGKHSGHITTVYSCDQCHRSSAWIPASWNHNWSVGACSTCHQNSALVSAENLKPAGHVAPALKGTLECDTCHNYNAWYPNRYKHNTVAACSSCHNGSIATGTPAGHVALNGVECNECHTSTLAWLPALGAKPATHIPYNGGVNCSACHVGGSVKSGSALHVPALSGIACYTCHGSNTIYPGNGQKRESWPSFHESSKNPSATDCSSSNCHKPGAGGKGVLYIDWD